MNDFSIVRAKAPMQSKGVNSNRFAVFGEHDVIRFRGVALGFLRKDVKLCCGQSGISGFAFGFPYPLMETSWGF